MNYFLGVLATRRFRIVSASGCRQAEAEAEAKDLDQSMPTVDTFHPDNA